MNGNWGVKITHPADVAGNYGPYPGPVARLLARTYAYPQSAFPYPMTPGTVLAALIARQETPDDS